jgi:hypothetical protein
VAGTKTNCETETLEIADSGTETTKLEATELGILLYSTTANDGDEAMTITTEVESDLN